MKKITVLILAVIMLVSLSGCTTALQDLKALEAREKEEAARTPEPIVVKRGENPMPALVPEFKYGTFEEPVYSKDGKGYIYEKNGWFYLHTEGTPTVRGTQQGELLGKYISFSIDKIKSYTAAVCGIEWNYLKTFAEELWRDKIDEEYSAELYGISSQMAQSGGNIDFWDLVVLNGYEELINEQFSSMRNNYYSQAGASASPQEESSAAKRQASASEYSSAVNSSGTAFIATGSYTKDGKVVMAHNSIKTYATGFYCNVISDIKTDLGAHITMQTAPGCIYSAADVYVTDNLLIGASPIENMEVSGRGVPMFIRSRRAAEYSASVSEFAEMIARDGSGGARVWLVGGVKTHEIMRLELGVNYSSVQKTLDGAYSACGLADNAGIRNFETKADNYSDIRGLGAMRVRFEEALERNHGNIDSENAKTIIADHYDVYLQKRNSPSLRTICTHGELDSAENASDDIPYQSYGSIGGVVCTGSQASEHKINARAGAACGIEFDVSAYLDKRPQFNYLSEYLFDRPAEQWCEISPK